MKNGDYGFYDDDGTEIDPELVPKPTLCLLCENDDDPYQEILCTLTRLDQRDDTEFHCFAFKPKKQ